MTHKAGFVVGSFFLEGKGTKANKTSTVILEAIKLLLFSFRVSEVNPLVEKCFKFFNGDCFV